MSLITARFRKSPAEARRYLLDYTLDLAVGESVTGIATSVISTTGELAPALVVNNVVLAPAVGGIVSQATFFLSGGTAGQSYEVQFLATTSIAQTIETVVAVAVQVKL